MAKRRTFIGGLAVLVAGCTGAPEATDSPTATGSATGMASPTASATPSGTGTPEGGVTEVAAGPEGRLRFRPDRVEIDVGDTVRWTFESPGHNVTTKPGASEKISIPESAEPFASYEGDQHYSVVAEGGTFEHTFTVPGEYVYVCAPHADQGMVGTVVVRGGTGTSATTGTGTETGTGMGTATSTPSTTS